MTPKSKIEGGIQGWNRNRMYDNCSLLRKMEEAERLSACSDLNI